MKNWIQAFSVIDFISVGILLTAIAMNALKRIESCVNVYILNSWLLSLLIAIVALMIGETHLYIASLVTLLSKGVVIPWFLKKIVRQMKVTRDVEPYISNALSLTISGMLVAVVYASLREGIFVTGFSRNVLQISIAIILVGLFSMITRRKAITQVIGLLFMENGLFLAGFSLTFGMPTIIELGVLFDMLMGVIILGIFAIQIKRVFTSSDLDKLTILKG
ncbi:MAG TPA: hydrogenase [Nitrospiraceae bacterium]|jgi:hydrogenase-4 component E|nr:hydrogenase [Nitrospiraceae bacterium]